MTREQQIAESLEIYQRRMLEVRLYIERHLAEHLTIDKLARVAMFSPFHFHRIFGQMVGEPIMSYVKRLRLERAATRLVCTDASIAEIAAGVGYETGESFARSFRKHFGLSPSTWRETIRPELIPEASPGLAAHHAPDVTSCEALEARIGICELERKPVAFVRHTGPYSHTGIAWQTLLDWLHQRELPTSPKWAIAWDEPGITPPDKLRYDACVEVAEDLEAESGIGLQMLAGGQYATIEHRGPVPLVGRAYSDLYGRWMPSSGFQPRDVPPLLQLQTPLSQLLSDQCVVRLYVPVEPLQP